ncbi:MAG: hypothetical protein LAO21_21980 [Acidobacteriia bacterium]|nr:hypothetical protein [Terriglobia bacterium]
MSSSKVTPSLANPKGRTISQSRRRMVKALVLAPLLPAVLSSVDLSPAQTQSKPEAKPAAPAQTGSQEMKPSPEAEALAEVVKQRYGKFLTDEQMVEVKLGLERGVRGRQRIRAFKLTNADEPVTMFHALDLPRVKS